MSYSFMYDLILLGQMPVDICQHLHKSFYLFPGKSLEGLRFDPRKSFPDPSGLNQALLRQEYMEGSVIRLILYAIFILLSSSVPHMIHLNETSNLSNSSIILITAESLLLFSLPLLNRKRILSKIANIILPLPIRKTDDLVDPLLFPIKQIHAGSLGH